jgi:uncharacterized membrane protein YoaK (UPF0700 family)
MLRAGSILLTVWSGVNLLLALGILVALTFLRQDAPALRILFDPPGIAAMDPKALATVNALAVFGNACAAGFCLLILFVVWTRLAAGSNRAFWALALSAGLVQAFGFVSDSFLDDRNLVANLVSAGVLLAGLVLSGAGIRRRGWATLTPP